MNNANVQPIEFSVAEAEPTGKALVQPDLALIETLSVQLDTQIGVASMSVKQLYALRQGDIVSLNTEINDDINLLLNGNVVARGKLVASDGHFAIEITALPQQV